MRSVEVTVYNANELNKFSLMRAYTNHLSYLFWNTVKEDEINISVEEFIEASNNNGDEYLEDGSLFCQ